MDRESAHILWFEELSSDDVALVGGKNAALGEMIQQLVPAGVRVPNGFAVTAAAYRAFLEEAGIAEEIARIIRETDTEDIAQLRENGARVRSMILDATTPSDIAEAVDTAYDQLSDMYPQLEMAVRSSATAEDLPDASFAGQQETFLNISDRDELHRTIKECFASLFTDRAISYRADRGFTGDDIALSVGVQKMVRSDLAASGVMFTLDTETGFDNVIVIDSAYGLGDYVVQGKVIPDEFTVFKPALDAGRTGVIAASVGNKSVKEVYADAGVTEASVSSAEQRQLSISRDEAHQLAQWGLQIERHFSERRGQYQPMDIEWAKDGNTGDLFIVQARPETVHSNRDPSVYREYVRTGEGTELVRGTAVGTKIATGTVNVITDVNAIDTFQEDAVLVTTATDPDWEPIMKKAAAIITDEGGRTSHAAIVSRELGIPCIVGAGNATSRLEDGQAVTIDCSGGEHGRVFAGELAFDVREHDLGEIPETRTKVMVNIGAPDEAFKHHYLPVQGVGLGRLEFIINSHIGIHPNAFLEYESLAAGEDEDAQAVAREIDTKTDNCDDKAEYFRRTLAGGMAKIGAVFHPHPVIIRFSDFKTNEYRALTGGERYEPHESNPMLGWRGASRYDHPAFREAFALECQALKMAREEMGVDNLVPMVPFCRTPEEGQQVIARMADNGLVQDPDNGFPVYMMCELPTNVLRADAFLDVFDGFSIGSNDLTQLVLGIDRDSDRVSGISDERDPAVMDQMATAVAACRERGKYAGICGQAPSDFPEVTEFLVRQGIASISLSPDTVIATLPRIAEAETGTDE